MPPRALELEQQHPTTRRAAADFPVFGGKRERPSQPSLSHSPAFETTRKDTPPPQSPVHHITCTKNKERWGSSRSYPSGKSTCPSGRRPTPESWSTYAVSSRRRCPTCARTPPSRPPTFGCICAPGTASASRTRWRLTS